MFKRYGLLLLVVGMGLVFSAGLSRAWLIGDFQIPVPAQKVKPRPAAAATSGSGAAVVTARARTRAGQTFTDLVTGMKFVWVKGGCFSMGSPSGEKGRGDDEGPVHKVCVDGFWMGKYEVTQGQWQKLMGSNPSRSKKGDNYPVEEVSWNDCQEFIKKLNRRSGKIFRLPTEAEWEYACRSGGKDEKYSGGSDVGRAGWYDANSGILYWGKSTHVVGGKAANGLGIFDMSGNVWE